MLKLLSVSLIACIAAPVAFAADLPTKKAPPAPFVAPPPAFSWTGWYFGATAGLAHSNNNLKAAAVAGTNINALAAGAARAIGDIDADQYSFTGGVEGGYNYQYGNLVLGAEADVEYIGGRRTQDTGNLNYGGVTIREINTVGSDWLATVRARLGYAVVDRMLVYATGGVAFADMTFNRQLNWSFVDGCAIVGGLESCHNGSTSQSVGWAVGTGAEYAIDSHWSVKGEFLFADFGKLSFATNNSGAAFTPPTPVQTINHWDNNVVEIFRAGLNYRF